MISTGVILAGGFGTRLAPITNLKHKSLVFVGDKTILELQINQLLGLGIERILLLTGHLSNQVESFVSAKYAEVNVKVLESNPNYSPRERILKYRETIGKEFILLYCDNFINNTHTISNLIGTDSPVVFLLNNRQEGNIEIIDDLFVQFHDRQRSIEHRFVELGYTKIISDAFFKTLEQSTSLTNAYEILTRNNRCRFLIQEDKYVSLSNLANYQNNYSENPIILLDRDGIINQKMPQREYVSTIDQFKYIDKNIEALQILSSYGFKFIVITNQPGVSTGSVSSIFLEEIHQKLTSDLRLLGIDVICVYTCVHHWDKNCECRKPKPGMILQAILDFRIPLDSTCYIGDEEKDKQAANAAKIKSVTIATSLQNLEGSFDNLLDAVPYLLNTFKGI